MAKIPWVRIVYLYLMTAIGLIVFIIGSVTIVNTGLKAFVFRKADMNYGSGPSEIYMQKTVEQAQTLSTCDKLTESERASIAMWLTDYKVWQETQKNQNPATSNRQREAATAIAMILVGFPVYFIHWRIIQKEKHNESLD